MLINIFILKENKDAEVCRVILEKNHELTKKISDLKTITFIERRQFLLEGNIYINFIFIILIYMS